MATRKQIAANRRNALKSTGPRTGGGKAVSRFNALRHGLRAKAVLPSPESLNELGQIRRFFLHSFQPQNPQQAGFVEQMASARWQLLYWQRAETQFFSQPSQADLLRQANTMEAFARRQGRYERAFTKAFEQFRRSTRARPLPRTRIPRVAS